MSGSEATPEATSPTDAIEGVIDRVAHVQGLMAVLRFCDEHSKSNGAPEDGYQALLTAIDHGLEDVQAALGLR